MVASYPNTIKTFQTHINIQDQIDASHPNDIQAEVVAIETILGVSPNISTTPSGNGLYNFVATNYTALTDRLANIEQGIVGDTHSQYLHLRGGDTVIIAAPTTVGQAIRGAASQSADLWQIFDSNPTKKVWVDSTFRMQLSNGATVTSGGVTITGDSSLAGTFNVNQLFATAATFVQVPMIVKMAPSQTADALQVQNSAGAVVWRIGAAGRSQSQLDQAFFIGGAFTAGVRAARWIVPVACTLNLGRARLDGGTGGSSVQWGLYVNGSQAATGGPGNLSASVVQGAGVSNYSLTVVLNAGDSVQLYIGTASGTCADFSVTLGGLWAAA